jgi:REP element-mobilizing transposase RayT
MKGGNRKFSTSGVLHIYQRARDRGIIFYTVIDRLVYLSILSVKSRQYEVKVLAVSIMFSHIHQSCRAGNKERIYKYRISSYCGEIPPHFCQSRQNNVPLSSL